MSSPDRTTRRHVLAFAGALIFSAPLAGCFRPLYAEDKTLPSGGVSKALANVEIIPIEARIGVEDEARIGVELRNMLIFDFTGGSGSGGSTTHRLKISLRGNASSVLIDRSSSRAEAENYSLDAFFSLIDAATGKVVLESTAVGRTSFDSLGQQRFARLRALREAEQRAARIVAEQIRGRLATYFASQS